MKLKVKRENDLLVLRSLFSTLLRFKHYKKYLKMAYKLARRKDITKHQQSNNFFVNYIGVMFHLK